MKNFIKTLTIFLFLSVTFSCSTIEKLDTIDDRAGLSLSELKKTMNKNKDEKPTIKQTIAPVQIPSISKLVVSTPPPVVGGDKIISFSITDQVPLKDVLIELGRVAKIDVDLDPGISGGIILNAKNKPLKEVIERIVELGKLRYSYKNGVLYFERDLPYMKNYFVDYLVAGSLWADVEKNINNILDLNQGNGEDVPAVTSSMLSNKSAGIMSIFATTLQHKAVEGYLADVEKYASAQVLIEAKVVEVNLSNEFKSGIQWSWINDVKGGNPTTNTTINKTGSFLSSAPLAITNISTRIFNGNINAAISALEQFGVTKTLSSPRVHAMNNQKATLKFDDFLVYFQVTNQNQSIPTLNGSGGNGGNNNVININQNSTIQKEPVGVELNITPSINIENNEVTMEIAPKISNQSGSVQDPANPTNIVPIVQSREIKTNAKIQSGNILVIGGLMKETGTNSDSGIPFISRIPVLGWFFKSIDRKSGITETVIFVKATIIKPDQKVNKHDMDLDQKVTGSKRNIFKD